MIKTKVKESAKSVKVTVELYRRGTNEFLDTVLEDHETLWIVQGPYGRRPTLANTEAEAIERYRAYGADPL